MPTAYTSLLGLALPVTGELSGTWGDTVNNSITSLLDTAIAGTTTLSTDADVTLTTTTGASNQARQAILLCNGARTGTKNITAPATSKTYVVINSTTGGFGVVIRGAGPTTGVTIANGERAVVAWNGSDFVKISGFGGTLTVTDLTVTGNTILGDAAGDTITVNGATTFTNVNPTLSAGTANGVLYLNGSKVATSGSALTFNGTVFTSTGGAKIGGGAATNNATLMINTPNGSAAGIQLFQDAQESWIMEVPASSTALRWTASGTEYMRLNATGLGIGTTPSYKLDVRGTNPRIYLGPNTGTEFAFLQVQNTGGSAFIGLENSAGSGLSSSSPYSLNIYHGGAYPIRFSTNAGANSMVYDSSGNLGIGTSSPGQRLEIQAPAGASQNATIRLRATDSGSGAGSVADIAAIGTGSQLSALAFSTRDGVNVVERMRLDSSGNLGIGTSSPNYKLDVVGAAPTIRVYSNNSGAATATMLIDAFDNSGYSDLNFSRAQLSVSQKIRAHHSGSTPSQDLAFWTGGTETMRLNGSGNLGLGVTPSAWGNGVSLQGNAWSISTTTGFDSAAFATNARQTAYGSGSQNWVYRGSAAAANYEQVAGQHRWFTSPSGTAGNAITFTQAMTLNDSGNLGLGVTPSAWISAYRAIDVGSTGSVYGRTDSSIEVALAANGYRNSSGNWIYRQTNIAGQFGYDTSGAWYWKTAPSGTAGNTISFTQAMTLDASGYLGIGLTSPVGRVTIKGAAGSSALQQLGFQYQGSSSYFMALGLNSASGDAQIMSGSGAALIFYTNSDLVSTNERARITSGGDLLVGTATAGAGAGFDARLAVEASSLDSSIFKFTGAAVAGYPVIAWHSATTGDNLLVRFATEGAITTRGNITYNRAGGLVAYNTTSDYRAKDIIGPVQNPGAVIDALKVYEGRMKGATQTRPMLVAHEAQEVTPYAVSGVKDEVTEDGSPKFQQIDVSSLVPLLLAEMQSLRARVAQLERH